MKARQQGPSPIGMHAILTGLALLAAYASWTRDRTQVQNDQVIALDVGKGDVSALTYDDENRTVHVEKKQAESGDYAWITVTTRAKQLLTNPQPQPAGPPTGVDSHGHPTGVDPHGHPVTQPGAPATVPGKPAAAPAGAKTPGAPASAKGGDKGLVEDGNTRPSSPPVAAPPVGGAPTAAPPAGAIPAAPLHEIKETVVTKSFRGNEQSDKLWEMFAPLRAVRGLGTVDEGKAKELGLDASKKSLTVAAKGQTHKFTLGGTAYGSGDVYARDGQAQTYLISHRTVSEFEFAESRLMERRLHRFERSDFDRIEVEVTTAKGAKKRTLLQKNARDNNAYAFVDAGAPDKQDQSLRNWVDKILRMAINDYVNKGEEPQPGAQASGGLPSGTFMTLKYFSGQKELGSATFSRYPGKAGPLEYFARTETTLGLVRLLNATVETAVQDAEAW